MARASVSERDSSSARAARAVGERLYASREGEGGGEGVRGAAGLGGMMPCARRASLLESVNGLELGLFGEIWVRGVKRTIRCLRRC